MFPLFSINTLVVKALIVAIGLGIVSSGYLYVRNLHSQIEIAEQNEEKLKNIINEKDIVMNQMKNDFDDMKRINSDLDKRIIDAEKDFANLKDRFENAQGKPRDFNRMAQRNSRELQERLNAGTRFALRCNEIVTGSPLKPEDDKNNICPDLIKTKKAEQK
jgi:septal ring factor EnvC (AmiA/AmiB activator)